MRVKAGVQRRTRTSLHVTVHVFLLLESDYDGSSAKFDYGRPQALGSLGGGPIFATAMKISTTLLGAISPLTSLWP